MKNFVNIIILICAYVNQNAAQGCVAVRQMNDVSTITSASSSSFKDDLKTESFLGSNY
jgi:hypothetical protein